MGLATDLGYRHRTGNAFQRLVAGFASTRPGAWLFAKSLRHLDTVVMRATRGRHSAPGLLAGLPVLDLTTTGRKSGQPRTSHLISIPIGDDLALLGTNFGQPKTPAWVFNLEADPHGTVTYRNTDCGRGGKAGDRVRASRRDRALGRRSMAATRSTSSASTAARCGSSCSKPPEPGSGAGSGHDRAHRDVRDRGVGRQVEHVQHG